MYDAVRRDFALSASFVTLQLCNYLIYHKIQITIKEDSYTKANEIGEEAQKETMRLIDIGFPQSKNKVNSNSFVLECFDGSEVTTREGNELVVQKENCVVEEIKEVELRSRRGKFIYNRTYNSIGLNQVSQLYFRQDKLP